MEKIDVRLNWRQACAYMHCSKTMFYRMIRQGHLKSYGVGARFRFVLKSDCERLLAEGAGDGSLQSLKEDG